MLFAIYFIAVLALAVSAYALWSLEEIRQYYAGRHDKKSNVHRTLNTANSLKKRSTATGHFDNIYK
jgi:hypothetical protein